MKKVFLWAGVVMTLLPVALHAQVSEHDWENPQVVGINKLHYHATLTQPSRASECSEMTLLNGIWKFRWSANPEGRDLQFSKADFDASTWSDIVVPGNWQMQGWGIPIYTNTTVPFFKEAPFVTKTPPESYYSYNHRNPVGQYITDFKIEKKTNRRYHILFNGVKSAMYIWVNGQKIGYSQNSMSPAEFDVTDAVHDGNNRLSVEVYRWSDGSYLEDQDMWRLSGIFRDVELWSRPSVYIRDYQISGKLNNQLNQAQFKVRFQLLNKSAKKMKGMMVRVHLKGHGVDTVSTVSVLAIAAGAEKEVEVTQRLMNPALWSSECPNLYHVDVALCSKGVTTEQFHAQYGFKKVETRGEVMYVNGKAIKLKGVNRHEHHPRTGRFVNHETMRKDLILMKQANINLLRTSHYPNTPYLYELCDQMGMYVMDEANNESHEMGIGSHVLGDDPLWRKAHVDRAVSLVKRDINHPCVLFWSLGNEAAAGENIKAMADTVRALDDSRLVYYDSDRSVSDIYDDGYLYPDQFKKLGEKITDRPVCMREYAHAMGNSLGNLQEYWDVVYADSSVLGAFIWDFVDQSIAKPLDGSALHYGKNPSSLSLSKNEFWAYGGDFGDQPNSSNFNINGMVGADRIPHPHYYEVQQVYQNILFKQINSTSYQLVNHYNFTSLNDFDYTYEYVLNGKVVSSGKGVLKDDLLNIPSFNHSDGECFVNLYARLSTSTQWANAGFAVAKQQFKLSEPWQFKCDAPLVKATLSKGGGAVLKSVGTVVVIDSLGAMTSWKHNGEELLTAPLEPYFWKPCNDNQRSAKFHETSGVWRNAAQQRCNAHTRLVNKNVVEITMQLPVGACYSICYSMDQTGGIHVENKYHPTTTGIPLLPKFGMRMRLPAEYNRVNWYGRGPLENYSDRKTSQFVGLYSMPLQQFITPYVYPQDNGNRTDVRWFSLSNTHGGIRVTGLSPLCFRAWPYSEDDVEAARHDSELPARNYVNVNIDLAVHGVGGVDTWGSKTLPSYSLSGDKDYRYAFVLNYIDD